MSPHQSLLPPLLQPYLPWPTPSSSSSPLVLVTETLGCTATWLVARSIAAAISSPGTRRTEGEANESEDGERGGEEEEEVVVVLATWLFSAQWWEREVRRVGGVEVQKALKAGQVRVVDFLTTPRLHGEAESKGDGETWDGLGREMEEVEKMIQEAILAATATKNEEPPSIVSGDGGNGGEMYQASNKQRRQKKAILILAHPSLLLALHPQHPPRTSNPATLLSTSLLRLRSNSSIHSTLILTSSLLPSSATATTTPLDLSVSNFTLHQSHLATYILSLRDLDTGAARDVSGILRVTRGGGYYDFYLPPSRRVGVGAEEEEEAVEVIVEGEGRDFEVLYLVRRDGGVRVWERGGDG